MKNKATEVYGVIGLGRFGFALLQTLAEAGKEVIVVDCNETKIKEATAFTDNAFMVDSLTKESLQEVGIKNCDTVIVCIGEKIDTSILTTLTVISLGIKRVIAKAISFEQGCVLAKLGAEVVYPERDMAIRLANKLICSQVMDSMSLSEDIDVTELKLTKKVNGISIGDINIRKKYKLNIISIKQGDTMITSIDPSLVLSEEDVMVVMGNRMDVKRFETYLEE